MGAAIERLGATVDYVEGLCETLLGKLTRDPQRTAYGEALRVRGEARFAFASEQASNDNLPMAPWPEHAAAGGPVAQPGHAPRGAQAVSEPQTYERPRLSLVDGGRGKDKSPAAGRPLFREQPARSAAP